MHGIASAPPLFDKVFIINLKHRPERFAFISEELSRSGISQRTGYDVERIDAVEGKHLNPTVLQERGFLSRLGALRLAEREENKIWGMDLNAGALGCAMSHVLLWSRIAQERLSSVLVVEDDSLFPPDGSFIAQYSDRMRHVPKPWHFVYISGLDTAKMAPALTVAPGVSLVPQMHRTTNAYVVSHDGARGMLEACLPLTYQIDTQMTAETQLFAAPQSHQGSSGSGGVPYASCIPHYYTLQPPIVVQATRFGSDIQAGARSSDEEELSRRQAAGW